MLKDTRMLVERCIRRDRKAWEQFIERFSGLLYYSASERLKRNGLLFGQYDLQDIVQGVFLELWQKKRLEEVRDSSKIGSWLSIIAQTRALNHIVRKKERLLSENESFRLDNLKVGPHVNGKDDLLSALDECVKELTPREKIILKLSIFYKKTHREIADFMGLPLNTVSTIIARKKGELRKKLKNFERK